MSYKRSFSLQDLKNKTYKKVGQKNSSTVIVNGRIMSSGSTKQINTMTALSQLNKHIWLGGKHEEQKHHSN